MIADNANLKRGLETVCAIGLIRVIPRKSAANPLLKFLHSEQK
jgi:hypothetical protein